MCTQESDSIIKKTLKSLCCNNGWSYGVFWRFDHRNSLLLTMQDAYYEQQMGAVIDDMLLQVHMLGAGIIGQTAFTKKHRWMFSDGHYGGENSPGSSQDIFQDDTEFHRQFASGIKTIAVISMESGGVVQFGSTQKILERTEFVNQTKRLFQDMENCEGLIFSENEPSSSYSNSYSPSGLFASLMSPENPCFVDLRSAHGASCHDFMETACFSTDPTQSFSFASDHTKVTPLIRSPSHINSQTPCSSSTWSNGDSTLTSFKQPASELWTQDSQNIFSAEPNSMSQHATESKIPERPTSVCTFEELFQSVDYATDVSKSCPLDNFSQCFAPPPYQNNPTLATTLNDYPFPHPTELIPANSVKSSITNIFNYDGKEKCSNNPSVEKSMFDSFVGVDFGCVRAGDWDDNLMPVVDGGHMDFRTDNTSECTISEQRVEPTFAPRKRLFSKLGIEQLLDGLSGASSNTVSRSSFEDLDTKRRRTSDLACFGRTINSSQPPYITDMTNNLRPKKEVVPKPDAGSWMGDSYSINGRSTVSDPKRNVEPAKPTKKKAKPGARPRPKDRQQIQDRVAELRELIPSGEKMSIDSLLDRTIKHMLFLQSVTKHADRLKRADEPKENGLVHQDNSSSSSGGVTWACEFGDQTMVCPLIVEDLSTPGQMLIEMLCEEHGFFLEIVDIIRGFGLTILKGVMEVLENKIWARFIVEAEGNRHVTRHEIFSALVQLLQLAASNGISVNDQLGNVIDGRTTLLNSCHQSAVPETLR